MNYKITKTGRNHWIILAHGVGAIEQEFTSESEALIWCDRLNLAFESGNKNALRTLASALKKFSPDLAAQLVERWQATNLAFEDLLHLLRASP